MLRRISRFLPFAVLFGLWLVFGFLYSAAADTKLYVKDGDSFVLGAQEIRLWGIDAVELHQFCWKDGGEYPCGQQARISEKGIWAGTFQTPREWRKSNKY